MRFLQTNMPFASLEKRREWFRKRYHTDEAFRKRHLEQSIGTIRKTNLNSARREEILMKRRVREKERYRSDQMFKLKMMARVIKHRKSPKGRYSGYKKSARERHVDFLITFEVFQQITQNPCWYCNSIKEPMGIDRIDNKQGYILANCRPCCSVCNYMKRTMTVEVFLNHCKQIANFHC